MAYLLGVDTGGTCTDAVIIDDAQDSVVASAKALTSRPDLAIGVSSAIDAAVANAGIKGPDVAMISLSTTLTTNTLGGWAFAVGARGANTHGKTRTWPFDGAWSGCSGWCHPIRCITCPWAAGYMGCHSG
ncbi:hydantoinase/oxoprolinase N-terminal domain-containing protein [Roseobacter sp. CCS2]|uniref:hydantoinase/oxoprolinase N-terminal domain-containing protein n=1 Tax=Roseobacter sp. CCS2 TaxID=391593 RepID=UPI0000F40539|nr:hydantoinase/oxoprolinase N-terminal domain-containing protein [Roseobacter sp. CCS2]EBA13901.1 hypothetical protein RCCS2_08429 [Roseobacter sp. CCS2]